MIPPSQVRSTATDGDQARQHSDQRCPHRKDDNVLVRGAASLADVVGARETFRKLHGERASISLQVADMPVSRRDQMHLDLYSAEPVEEVQRLVRFGATYVRHERDPDDDLVVLRDPDGNEFCVCNRPDDT